MRVGDIEKFLLHLDMAVPAPLDHLMFFDTVIDLFHRVTGETVAATISHFIGIGTVTVDAGQHRFMAEVRLDVFFQFRVAGKAVPGTGR